MGVILTPPKPHFPQQSSRSRSLEIETHKKYRFSPLQVATRPWKSLLCTRASKRRLKLALLLWADNKYPADRKRSEICMRRVLSSSLAACRPINFPLQIRLLGAYKIKSRWQHSTQLGLSLPGKSCPLATKQPVNQLKPNSRLCTFFNISLCKNWLQ
jgi:hypothetical protein